MPIIAFYMAKMKQMVSKDFFIKSQKWYNIFWGTNEGLAQYLGAQWKIRLCLYVYTCTVIQYPKC